MRGDKIEGKQAETSGVAGSGKEEVKFALLVIAIKTG